MWDAVVIGAGVVGCSAARFMSRYDMRVLVLEKGSDVCSGASKGNSAMVHGGFDPDPGTLKAIYNVRGNAMYGDLCSELEVPFQRSGTMLIATSEAEVQELRRLEKVAGLNGVPVEVLLGDALRAREPELGAGVVGALIAPTGGIVCPYGLVIALAENACANGVRFRLNSEVKDIRPDGKAWCVTTGDGASFETRLVFNCAGTHADKINDMVSKDRFRILPRFGSHLILDREYGKYVKMTISQTPVALPTGGHTKGQGIMPSVDGTVILGCDAEDYSDPDDVATTARSLKRVADYFVKMWPLLPIGRHVDHFPFEGVIGAYGGLRPHPDRDDYIIGEAADAPGFVNAAGIESPGLTAGPAIGQYLSELAADMLNARPNAGFNPIRHAVKRFRDMTDAEKAEAIRRDPDYGRIVCRCEQVTEAEIRAAVRGPLGARSVGAVKMRTRAGMGRCQGGFCSPRVVSILSEELGIDPLEVTQSGGDSFVLGGRACEHFFGGEAER